jgi:hypothetical protein
MQLFHLVSYPKSFRSLIFAIYRVCQRPGVYFYFRIDVISQLFASRIPLAIQSLHNILQHLFRLVYGIRVCSQFNQTLKIGYDTGCAGYLS